MFNPDRYQQLVLTIVYVPLRPKEMDYVRRVVGWAELQFISFALVLSRFTQKTTLLIPLEGNWNLSNFKNKWQMCKSTVADSPTFNPGDKHQQFFYSLFLISSEHICLSFSTSLYLPPSSLAWQTEPNPSRYFFSPPTVRSDDITFKSPFGLVSCIGLIYFWASPRHGCSNLLLNAQPSLLSIKHDI